IAINPFLASHDRAVRRRTRWQARAAGTLGRIGPLRRAIIRRMGARAVEMQTLEPEVARAMIEETVRLPAGVMSRVLAGLADAPPRFGRQRRAAIVVCVDDPYYDAAVLDRAAAEVGIEPAHVHRLPDGGHHPQVTLAAHP